MLLQVEILEQQARTYPRLFHTRLSAALLISIMFNLHMLRFCVTTVLQQARPNMVRHKDTLAKVPGSHF